DLTERHRLQRLFGNLPQHGRRPEPDLLPDGRLLRGAAGITIRAYDIVQRSREVRVRKPIGHDPVDDSSPPLDSHDRADADARLGRGPEMELVRSGGLQLGRDDSPDGSGWWSGRRRGSRRLGALD